MWKQYDLIKIGLINIRNYWKKKVKLQKAKNFEFWILSLFENSEQKIGKKIRLNETLQCPNSLAWI